MRTRRHRDLGLSVRRDGAIHHHQLPTLAILPAGCRRERRVHARAHRCTGRRPAPRVGAPFRGRASPSSSSGPSSGPRPDIRGAGHRAHEVQPLRGRHAQDAQGNPRAHAARYALCVCVGGWECRLSKGRHDDTLLPVSPLDNIQQTIPRPKNVTLLAAITTSPTRCSSSTFMWRTVNRSVADCIAGSTRTPRC